MQQKSLIKLKISMIKKYSYICTIITIIWIKPLLPLYCLNEKQIWISVLDSGVSERKKKLKVMTFILYYLNKTSKAKNLGIVAAKVTCAYFLDLPLYVPILLQNILNIIQTEWEEYVIAKWIINTRVSLNGNYNQTTAWGWMALITMYRVTTSPMEFLVQNFFNIFYAPL